MGIRDYLSLVRRRWWLIAGATAVVLFSTAVFYLLRTPEYRGTALVLIRQQDPSQLFVERPGPEGRPNAQAEGAFADSYPVATEVAKSFPGTTAEALMDTLSVEADEESGLVQIHATDADPAKARDIANSAARVFVESRRQAAARRSENLGAQLNSQLDELRKQIADLTAIIGDGGLPPGPLNAASVGAPGSPEARRYAAAVQYQEVFERQQLLLIEGSVQGDRVELVSQATTPGHPVGPGLLRSLAVALVVGLLLGFGLAVVRDHLDDRVQEGDEAEAETGLPTLGALPRIAEGDWSGPAVAAFPHSALAEAVRSLRVSLEHATAGRRLLVTSPSPQDGKSFVAANLAVAFAQAGYRTVLVSSDLRRPTIEATFGLGSERDGLSTILQSAELRPVGLRTDEPRADWPRGGWAGEAPSGGPTPRSMVAGLLVATEIPNLSVLPSGPLPPNPAELLSSAGTVETLDELGSRAEMVILDSPPVLAVADASELATDVDGVILVAARARTSGPALRRARTTLDRTGSRVLGVVLNMVTKRSQRDGYYGGADGGPVGPTAQNGSGDTSVSGNGRGGSSTAAAPSPSGPAGDRPDPT